MSGRYASPSRARARLGGRVRVSWTLGVCLLALSALCYLGWVLAFFLPTTVPAWQSHVGELSAAGRPYRDLFRGIDFAAGVAALTSAPFLARLVPAQLMPRLTVLAIASFGIIMLLRGGLTLDCAPSISESCRQRQASGALSSTHQVRRALSVAMSVLFLLGVVTAERWFARGFWRNGLRIALALAAASAVAVLVLDSLGHGHFVGVAVRVQLAVQAATLLFGAAYLVNVSRWPPDRKPRGS